MKNFYYYIGAVLALILFWQWYQDRSFDQAAASLGFGSSPAVTDTTNTTDP